MSFMARIKETAEKNESNLVLALDFPFQNPAKRGELLAKAQHILNSVQSYLCAVKINHHLVLPLGTFEGVQRLVKRIHEAGLLAIMDCKVNDIGSTNQVIAEYYYSAGFDALIANPFIGWEEGLQPIFSVAQNLQRGVILLTYMSHRGAKEGYGQITCDPETGAKIAQYISFARKALKWNADGAVVGATYPHRIREIREILQDEVPIYSPGIGVQGGTAKAALDAGASYLIVGREITLSDDPAGKARKLKESLSFSK